MPDAIAVTGLAHRYAAQEHQVLRGIALRIPAGETFGLLGPNGAGKTTALRLLLGLLDRQEGQVTVLGDDPAKLPEGFGRRVGVVLEDNPLVEPRWRAAEYLAYFGRYLGLAEEELARRSVGLIASLGIDAQRRVGAMSHGNRRKLQLARALLPQPQLLVLDEPTLGLDLPTKLDLWGRLRTLARTQGTTVLLSSHEVQEIATLCDRVGVLRQGRLAGPLGPQPQRLHGVATVEDPLLAARLGGGKEGAAFRTTAPRLAAALAATLEEQGHTGSVRFGASMQECLEVALALLGGAPLPTFLPPSPSPAAPPARFTVVRGGKGPPLPRGPHSL